MQSCGNLTLNSIALRPGQEWETASGAWRLIRLTEGLAYWLGDNSNQQLVGGELALLSPGAHGKVRASILTAATLHVVSFAPGSLLGLFSLRENQLLAEIENTLGSAVRLLPSTHPAAQRLEAVLRARTRNPPRLLEKADLLGIALCALSEDLEPYSPPSALEALAVGRFEQLVGVLPDRELLNCTASQLAVLCRCSLGHFHRLFRARFGVSFRERQAALKQAAASLQVESVPGTTAPLSSPILNNRDTDLPHNPHIVECIGGEKPPSI